MIKNLEKLIKFPSNICIAGRTGSGKTHFTKKLLEYVAPNFDHIISFTSTHYNQDFQFLNVKSREVTVARIHNVVEILEKWKAKGETIRVCMIIDDFVGVIKTAGPVFDRISTSARHFGLTTIWLTQKITKCISPVMRDNIRYWILFSNMSESSIGAVGEFVPGYPKSSYFFSDYSKYCSSKYCFCFIDLYSETPQIYYCQPINTHGRICITGRIYRSRSGGKLQFSNPNWEEMSNQTSTQGTSQMPELFEQRDQESEEYDSEEGETPDFEWIEETEERNPYSEYQ